jgi:hypothetical protein
MLTSVQRLFLGLSMDDILCADKGKAKLLETKDGNSPDSLNPICRFLRTLPMEDSRSLPNQTNLGR